MHPMPLPQVVDLRRVDEVNYQVAVRSLDLLGRLAHDLIEQITLLVIATNLGLQVRIRIRLLRILQATKITINALLQLLDAPVPLSAV